VFALILLRFKKAISYHPHNSSKKEVFTEEEVMRQMASEKKALWVVFKMEEMPAKEEMRQRFENFYHLYRDNPGIESKCWLVNEDENEWGALYVFRSEKALQEYLKSDLWLKEIPGRWGLSPEVVRVLDPGPILYKETIVQSQNSWLSE
jgi:hypothetical protein